MSRDEESEELVVFSSAGFLLRGVTADSSNGVVVHQIYHCAGLLAPIGLIVSANQVL